MPTIKSDIIDGNRADLSVKGWEFSRVFIVHDLTAPGYAMLVEAVDFLGLVYGQPHPEIPAARAVRITPESIGESGNAARVTVQYREFLQDFRVELGNRLLTNKTSNAIINPSAGTAQAPMKLFYRYPDDYKTDTDRAGELADTQGVTLDVQDYFPTIIITRTEYTTTLADTVAGWPAGIALTGEILTDRGVNYNGKTNLSGWNLRPSDQEYTWRCEITSSSAEDGLAYRVRYKFLYDPNQWMVTESYVDPLTGQTVPDHGESPVLDASSNVLGESEETFHMFDAMSFSELELY